MTDWYYADASNARQGPVPTAELLRLRQAGHIGDATLLWRDGLVEWTPLRDLAAELGSDAQAVPPPDAWALEATEPTARDDAPQPGDADPWRPVTERETAPQAGFGQTAASSPYAPPTAPVDRPDAVVHGGEIVYAGFLKRVAAYVIDGLIVGVAGMLVGGLVGGVIGGLMAVSGAFGDMGLVLIQVVANLLSIVITAGYYAWFHASRSMATPGKMAVGIKVVRLNGERISLARGIGRYFATLLSGLILGIGFLMAGFTARKQALHDMICDTLVVDKWAFTATPELQRRELGTVTVVVLAIFGVLLALGLLVFLVAVGWAISSR
ncbi:RDD family protein [Luteimonas sp. WGS1318]|uniref:RDD family protein n=1 Tax=Luteimonas sp. WGS1318 TaxID=3366815 RepID=UPI00372D21D0